MKNYVEPRPHTCDVIPYGVFCRAFHSTYQVRGNYIRHPLSPHVGMHAAAIQGLERLCSGAR